VQSVDFSRIRLFHGKKLKSSFVFIKWIDYISGLLQNFNFAAASVFKKQVLRPWGKTGGVPK
jgi:hypothetical protein